MADPRTFTVKQCPPAYAAKSAAQLGDSSSTRRDFFNAIGKVGDLQILNSVGGGTVGQGLRTLASISNSIRTGAGALPTTIGSSIEQGANWVLEQTGIAPAVIDTLRGLNPSVANQGYGQAKAIYERVKQGHFKITDIPGYLQDLQNLERLGRNIFTPWKGDANTTLGKRCGASPYAMDLIARAPKYKFLFVVQFVAEDGYSSLGDEGGPLDMAFTIKTSTRPSLKYITEDVNYYNFRTKVITKTEFEEMKMSFHDDVQNIANRFYHAYMRATIPITGVRHTTSDPALLEHRGMSFVDNTLIPDEIVDQINTSTYAASSGILAQDRKQVFKEIKLFHVFDSGHRMNVWRFFNPKITALNLDDLDMSAGSEGSELSLSFSYDSVFLDPDVYLAETQEYDIKAGQRGAMYPLEYKGPAPTTAVPGSPTLPSIPGLLGSNPLNIVNNAVKAAAGGVLNSVKQTAQELQKSVSNINLPF